MIGVVLINYKNFKETIRTSRELIESDDTEKQIIIVDNSEDAAEFSNLRNAVIGKKNIIIIQAPYNLGYARGNNLGVRTIQKEFPKNKFTYFLFANSDISFPEKNVIKRLINEIENDPFLAACNPQIINSEETFNQTPFKFLRYHNKFTLKYLLLPISSKLVLKYCSDLVNNAKKGIYYRLSGAFLLIKSKAFLEIDGFDEYTFLYAEEAILSEKLNQINYKCFYVPEVKIYHEVSVEVNKHFSNSRKDNLIFKNNSYYYKKYKGLSKFSYYLASFTRYIYWKLYRTYKG